MQDSSSPSRLWNHDADTPPGDDDDRTKVTIVNEDVPSDYRDLISLHNMTLSNSRIVSFSTAGDPSGMPVLFHYAGGCNRRILLLLQEAAEDCHLRFICVNRPGRGMTSPANYDEPVVAAAADSEKEKEFSIRVVMAEERDEEHSSPSKNDKHSKLLSTSHARIHMETCLSDAIAVLDALHIDQVGQCFECAGAPFALSFCQHHSHRLLPNTPMIGIGTWIQPADCNETKQLFQFGARKCPVWLIAPLISGSMGSLDKSASWVPATWIGRQFTKHLTLKEQAVFDANWELQEFVERFRFMQQEGGGTVMADLTCLLSPAADIGLDYGAIQSRIVLVHAMDDKMAPLPAAQWLKEQLPNCRLIQVAEATHEGMLFLLHQEIEQSLKLMTRGEPVPETDHDHDEPAILSHENGDGKPVDLLAVGPIDYEYDAADEEEVGLPNGHEAHMSVSVDDQPVDVPPFGSDVETPLMNEPDAQPEAVGTIEVVKSVEDDEAVECPSDDVHEETALVDFDTLQPHSAAQIEEGGPTEVLNYSADEKSAVAIQDDDPAEGLDEGTAEEGGDEMPEPPGPPATTEENMAITLPNDSLLVGEDAAMAYKDEAPQDDRVTTKEENVLAASVTSDPVHGESEVYAVEDRAPFSVSGR